MINMIKSLVDIITNLLTFIGSIIVSFTNLLLNIPKYILFIQTNLTILPNIIIPFVFGSLSIYIIFLILGRNSS